MNQCQKKTWTFEPMSKKTQTLHLRVPLHIRMAVNDDALMQRLVKRMSTGGMFAEEL